MNKNIKFRNNVIFIVMVVLTITILLGTGAYAYYRTTISGTTSGTIARWSFKANDQTESFNLDLGSLYPGKTGTYNLELSAENSDLDVYYEFIIHNAWQLTDYLFFDNSYTIGPSSDGNWIVGKYGVIPAGQKITIPLYYNWSYNNYDASHYADGSLVTTEISIIGQQYTSFNGSIPMNLFNLTLVSSDLNFQNNVIPVACESDEFDYGCLGSPYRFEPITQTTGYIIKDN